MKKQLIPFKNEEFGEVRTIQMESGELWFVGKDVCNAFGDKNHNRSLGRLDDDEKMVVQIVDRMGRDQEATAISESGLYALLFSMQPKKANKDGGPNAYPKEVQERVDKLSRFKRWVTHDILPSIRKHGAYLSAPVLERAIADPDTMIGLLQELKKEQEARKKLEEHKKVLEAKIENDKPKVDFADAVTDSEDTILVGELAKLISQNGIEIGEKRLYHWMRDNGYIMKRSRENVPTQKSMELGLFKIKEDAVESPDQKTKVSKTPLVTGKGQKYFMNFFVPRVDKKQIDSL